MEDFIGKYDGNQIDSRLDKVKDMVGATASQAGEDGLVPAPAKGDEGRFLCGDGTWKDVVVEPDYTVFDIVMEISSSGNLSISQENYNKLLEKLPSNAVNIFPVRDVTPVHAFAFSPNIVKRRRSRTSHVGNFFV